MHSRLKDREETGNVVEDYMQGNVRIRIFDSAYINRTKEDIDRTLQRINQIARRAIFESSKMEQ